VPPACLFQTQKQHSSKALTCTSAQVPQLPRAVQLHLCTRLLLCIALLLRLWGTGPEPITLPLLLLLLGRLLMWLLLLSSMWSS
jgi:hypothetical protein